jgi:subtilisin family serine protease
VLSSKQYDWRKLIYAIPLNQSLDEMGHGTAVASTVLSVAPNVTLYSARVTIDVLLVDDQNRVYAKQVLIDPFAINWALTHAIYGPDLKPGTSDDADIVNMSLGGLFYPYPSVLGILNVPEELLYWYLFELPIKDNSNDVLFVAAAGIGGEGIPAPPAGLDGVTAVAALQYIDGKLTVAPFSQTGYGIDFSELGSGMYLPVPSYSLIAEEVNDTCSAVSGTVKWVRLDGTSFAAPLLSGIAALWEQATGAKGEQLYQVLKEHAVDLGSPGYDQQTGWGMPTAPAGTTSLTTTSQSGVPMIFAPALMAFRKRKKVLLTLLGLSAIAFALNVTAPSISIAAGVALGAAAYLSYGDLLPSLIVRLLGFGILMSAFFIATLILRMLKK